MDTVETSKDIKLKRLWLSFAFLVLVNILLSLDTTASWVRSLEEADDSDFIALECSSLSKQVSTQKIPKLKMAGISFPVLQTAPMESFGWFPPSTTAQDSSLFSFAPPTDSPLLFLQWKLDTSGLSPPSFS